MLSVEKVSLIVNFFSSFKTYLMEGEMGGHEMEWDLFHCNENVFNYKPHFPSFCKVLNAKDNWYYVIKSACCTQQAVRGTCCDNDD